jgi:methyl-accepting chemotaxis protein
MNSIKFKILLLPLIATIGTVIYLIIASSYVISNQESLQEAADIQFPVLNKLANNINQVERLNETLTNAAVMADEDILAAGKKLSLQFSSNLSDIKKIDPSFSRDAAVLEDLYQTYFNQAYAISLSMVEDTVDFETLGDKSTNMQTALTKLNEELEKYHSDYFDAFTTSISHVNQQSSKSLMIGFIMAGVISLVMFATAIPVALLISGSIKNVVDSLRRIAEEDGDLTLRISTKSKDEIGEMVHWFNIFISKLQSVVTEVVVLTPQLSDLAKTLHTNSEENLQNLVSQSNDLNMSNSKIAQLKENGISVSSTSEDCAHKVQLTFESAQDGEKLVNDTKSSIEQLSKKLSEASNVVNQLGDDSKEVSAVLNVIKGIAEQTNLLALNAAIEAARAGEQGRGFAVVADEVRTLASRTQDSTEEINRTIEKLQGASGKAVEAMNDATLLIKSTETNSEEAVNSLNKISVDMMTVTKSNKEVADLTSEQSNEATDILSLMVDIDSKANLSRMSSESVSDLSTQLKELSHSLNQTISQFKVN